MQLYGANALDLPDTMLGHFGLQRASASTPSEHVHFGWEDPGGEIVKLLHGHYKAVRSWKGTVAYVLKEDISPATFGVIDTKQYLKDLTGKKNGTLSIVSTAILKGKYTKFEDVVKDYPQMLITHKRKIEDAFTWVEERKRLRPDKVWTPFDVPAFAYDGLPELAQIAEWCNLNLGDRPRDFKQKQLWICSPPDFGKTTFAKWLMDRFHTYILPVDDAWDDLFNDNYQLVIIDEFNGQRRISWLNGFVQGGRFPVKRRGTAPVVKTRNIPVIVLSNYTPQNAYNNCPHVAWESIMARFTVVNLTHEQTMFDREDGGWPAGFQPADRNKLFQLCI